MARFRKTDHFHSIQRKKADRRNDQSAAGLKLSCLLIDGRIAVGHRGLAPKAECFPGYMSILAL
jgi:hypothetical protein